MGIFISILVIVLVFLRLMYISDGEDFSEGMWFILTGQHPVDWSKENDTNKNNR